MEVVPESDGRSFWNTFCKVFHLLRVDDHSVSLLYHRGWLESSYSFCLFFGIDDYISLIPKFTFSMNSFCRGLDAFTSYFQFKKIEYIYVASLMTDHKSENRMGEIFRLLKSKKVKVARDVRKLYQTPPSATYEIILKIIWGKGPSRRTIGQGLVEEGNASKRHSFKQSTH